MNGHRVLVTTFVAALALYPDPAAAEGDDRRRVDDASPVLRIEPRVRDHDHRRSEHPPLDVRSIDGRFNDLEDVERNATHTRLVRTVRSDYADGVSSLAGPARLGAREVSNRVNAQVQLIENRFGTSDFLWQWGQFLDHDIDLTDGTEPPEPAFVPVPSGDPYFDPAGGGVAVIPFNRSLYDPDSGTDAGNPREQLNEVTGWIDASNVYGADPVRAAALRTNDGSGRLKTSVGDLLPDSDGTLPNATGGSDQTMFLAGDVRANEQLGLRALHTLFVREHNRLAERIRRDAPQLDGDQIYERARRLVGAMMQVITYEEFLPALLGPDALSPYRGYDPGVDAGIANEFSTAAYRFGHSALPPQLLRLDEDLSESAGGPVPLRDAFFDPDRMRFDAMIDPILRGLAHQRHQAIDVFVIDDVRNFLFGQPGEGGFDLAALNIQRGRDHGLGSYNDAREAYGLPRVSDFSEISSVEEVRARLASAYATVDDIDMWVGGLAEDPEAPGSQVGPLIRAVLVEQFTVLRDGDRFWYQRALGRADRDAVRRTRLADVIRRNTGIGGEIPDDVFHVDPASGDTGPGRDRHRRRGLR